MASMSNKKVDDRDCHWSLCCDAQFPGFANLIAIQLIPHDGRLGWLGLSTKQNYYHDTFAQSSIVFGVL